MREVTTTLWKQTFGPTFLSLLLFTISVSQNNQRPKLADQEDLAKKISRFAPTTLTADLSHLSPGDRKALAKIIEAAKLLDPLFLRQVWSGNEALQKKLAADTSPEGKAKLHYFRINVGPW